MKDDYTYHFKIHCWFDNNTVISVPNQIVLELMTGVFNQSRTLYTDNWYTSVGLVKPLEKNTHVLSISRSNRKETSKNEEKNGIKATKLRDKSVLLLLNLETKW